MNWGVWLTIETHWWAMEFQNTCMYLTFTGSLVSHSHGFKYWINLLLAAEFWASYLASLDFSFFFWGGGEWFKEFSELTHIKHPVQCFAHSRNSLRLSSHPFNSLQAREVSWRSQYVCHLASFCRVGADLVLWVPLLSWVCSSCTTRRELDCSWGMRGAGHWDGI